MPEREHGVAVEMISMRRYALIACILFGCGQNERDRFSDLASRVNPVLQRVLPVAKEMAALRSHVSDARQRDQLIRTCMSVPDELQSLASLRREFLPFLPAGADGTRFDVSATAELIVHEKLGSCRSGGMPEACAMFCIETWEMLVERVDRMNSIAPAGATPLVRLR